MYDIGPSELKAVERVLKRRKFFRYGGTETTALEQEWASLMQTPYALTTTSGTASLIVALKAMGLGPGDSVLVPGYTFISTALAVTAVGAIPIYTEIDAALTLGPGDVTLKVRAHTRCRIPDPLHISTPHT